MKVLLLAALLPPLPVLRAAPPAAEIDALFAPWNSPHSPGCAVGVFENGKPVHQRGYGMANLEHQVAITPQTAFYLSSTSKPFTALTLQLLIDQGKLSDNDPVRKWLPQLPAYFEPVRVRHLLEHTSGIRDYMALWMLSGPEEDAVLGPAAALDLISRQHGLQFQPGQEFLYSNSGYFLAALIAERAAGQPLAVLAEQLVFSPLGMRATRYLTDRFRLLPNRATGYAPSGNGDWRIATQTLELAGDGALFATLEDLGRWSALLAAPQGAFARALAQMTNPARLSGGMPAEYGRGMMLKRHRGHSVWSHAGGFRGYRSEIVHVPQRRLTVVCLCNSSNADAGRLARRLLDIVLPPASSSKPVSSTDLESKTGVFRDRASGDLLRLSVQNGRLIADFNGLVCPLVEESPLSFVSQDAPVHLAIEFSEAGGKVEPHFLRVESEVHKPAHFERISLHATPENPAQFEGIYWSEEANTRLAVRAVDFQIELLQGEQSLALLNAVQPDRYVFASLNLEFARDGSGRVRGFHLNTGRLRRLWFARLPQPNP